MPLFDPTLGDSRVNLQVLLTMIHNVWLRFHNEAARELERLNPHWNDEVLYQEARRVVVACIQHIVYNEYLPILLGRAGKSFRSSRGSRCQEVLNAIWIE